MCPVCGFIAYALDHVQFETAMLVDVNGQRSVVLAEQESLPLCCGSHGEPCEDQCDR